MTPPTPKPDETASNAFSLAALQTLLASLEAPLSANPADDLAPLKRSLADLRANPSSPLQRAPALDRIYSRGMLIVSTLLPSLSETPFPLPRKTRHLVSGMHELLRALGEELLSVLKNFDEQQARSLRQQHDLILWKCLNALGQHLLLSNLAAAPAGNDIWRQLHQAHAMALALDLSTRRPKGATCSLQNLYYSFILLGCAQPASFTSREIRFVADYLELFSDQIDPGNETASDAPAAFWIDPAHDAPAVACARKAPPPKTHVLYFSCARIASLLANQLASLESGVLPPQLGLPDFAGTPAGRGVMRRLIHYWGEPGKRRFPRRRQNYRAALCSGLGSLWHMFQKDDSTPVETSSWMITNESPDGYAIMHVAGKTGSISVGDITAIRTETGDLWQICIVRWALSENQEHLELGLQILATRAVPAFLALPADSEEGDHLSVLILPEIPPLRSAEMLVVPTGALENQLDRFVLLVQKGNLAVREARSTRLEEQNSQIEVFSIEADSPSS